MIGDTLEFTLTQEYIELIKLLKLENVVESGSEAKWVVDQGLVKCNDEVEFRKRRKLRPGDIVEFANHKILIK